ncbi:MAG: ATP-grasp domain-containing protein [Acutalibacteraceae bacterium]|nr:ATP-grasp domain-containing protein [Acutalibacteraceae bacterium]
MKFSNKKLLVLGGKPIGSVETVEYAKANGAYTIVADYLSVDESPAKKIADEYWDISTADLESLKKKIIETGIDGIYSGVHEFNIEKMITLCEELNLPCFCNLQQWKRFNNKREFKKLCAEHGIPVAKEYEFFEDASDSEMAIEFPVVVKPADGSGSRGFSICKNRQELAKAVLYAKNFSETKNVLIEQYIDYRNSAIINYTLINGEIYFSGISEKISKKVFDSGAPVMAVQYFRSRYEKNYLLNLDEKVKNMFLTAGLKNGVIWIEAFYNDGEFIFNEMGYRFGGSLTYYPVKYFYGIDQLDLQLQYALNKEYEKTAMKEIIPSDSYVILPIHVLPGRIDRIEGFDELLKKDEIKQIVYVHFENDLIENWGSAQQVFAYIHISTNSIAESKAIMDNILDSVSVKDSNGNELLFYLYGEQK